MPVKECGETLISLPTLFASHDIPVEFNGDRDVNAKTKKLYFLRKSVAGALLAAAREFLENGMILKIEDAYRSLMVQRIKFLEEVNELRKTPPRVSLEETKAKANTYIAGIPILAAHTAGAAVDVTLVHKDSLAPVNFGPSYHSLDETSITDYPDIPDKAKENRQFFKKIMEKHGLINYPFEYWHYSRGDVCSAYVTGQKEAIYAPVIIDEKSGEITAFVSSRSMRTYF
jgi:D-alanyl-D-alanine dipeptidase